jgi:hypothetical protein
VDLLNEATALVLDAAQSLTVQTLVELFGAGGGVAALIQNLKHLKYRDPVSDPPFFATIQLLILPR